MTTSAATQHSISVVVPVYNSELSLPELVGRLQPVLTGAASEFELLLVNESHLRCGFLAEAIAATAGFACALGSVNGGLESGLKAENCYKGLPVSEKS